MYILPSTVTKCPKILIQVPHSSHRSKLPQKYCARFQFLQFGSTFLFFHTFGSNCIKTRINRQSHGQARPASETINCLASGGQFEQNPQANSFEVPGNTVVKLSVAVKEFPANTEEMLEPIRKLTSFHPCEKQRKEISIRTAKFCSTSLEIDPTVYPEMFCRHNHKVLQYEP